MQMEREYDISLPFVLERRFIGRLNEFRLISLEGDDYPVVWSIIGGNSATKVFVDAFTSETVLVHENYRVEYKETRKKPPKSMGKLPIKKRGDVNIIAGLPYWPEIWFADTQGISVARRTIQGKWVLEKSDFPYYPVSTDRLVTSCENQVVLYSEHSRIGMVIDRHTLRKTFTEVDGTGCSALPVPCWYKIAIGENTVRFSVVGVDKEFGSFIVGHPNRSIGKAVVSGRYACLLLHHPRIKTVFGATLIAFFTIFGQPVWGGFEIGTPGQVLVRRKRAWVHLTKQYMDDILWQIHEFFLEYGYKQTVYFPDYTGEATRLVETEMARYNIESAVSAKVNDGIILVSEGECKYALLPPEIPLDSSKIPEGFVPIKFVPSNIPYDRW